MDPGLVGGKSVNLKVRFILKTYTSAATQCSIVLTICTRQGIVDQAVNNVLLESFFLSQQWSFSTSETFACALDLIFACVCESHLAFRKNLVSERSLISAVVDWCGQGEGLQCSLKQLEKKTEVSIIRQNLIFNSLSRWEQSKLSRSVFIQTGTSICYFQDWTVAFALRDTALCGQCNFLHNSETYSSFRPTTAEEKVSECDSVLVRCLAKRRVRACRWVLAYLNKPPSKILSN